MGATFIISIPDFWLCNSFRRGLFTLLLRCGACYYKGHKDLFRAFYDYELTRAIRPLLKLFLTGYTATTRSISHAENIYYNFSSLTEYQIKQVLFAPGKQGKFFKRPNQLKPVNLF
jgi:hypothetical protein